MEFNAYEKITDQLRKVWDSIGLAVTMVIDCIHVITEV